ncbi:unnamed protein product [Cuscuta epithymum]|uniref:Late embryogenesis abundant protein LEA-2 subgroup domain-containing protein n=1 Tax=Cuscuta epithymum TaxID=186058 RepID=A0AAV0DGL2_9ASTE|nr:unnamed protein product [Cuscuta epithymum]
MNDGPPCYIKVVAIVFVILMAIVLIFASIHDYQHPDPKAPAYSVVDVPFATINGSSRFTIGGNVTFILNTRNRNKRKYTNDYGTSQASLYFGAAAQELVANATFAAFLQPPGASNNLTLTFLAPDVARGDGGSTVVLRITASLRYDGYKTNDGKLQVTCSLPYDSSQVQAFHLPNQCHVVYQSCYITRYGGARRCV